MRRPRVSGFAGFSRRAAVPSIDPACSHRATRANRNRKDRTMETKKERKLELRGVSFVIAVIVTLMGFSAALATKEVASVAPTAEHQAPDYWDPSLAGLSVADDAEPDGNVPMYE